MPGESLFGLWFTTISSYSYHLQHTLIAVAFARWNFLLFLSLKTIKKNSSKKCYSYTRMLQMNPPDDSSRRNEHGIHKHAHGSWILCSVSLARLKTMHSLFCITSWLPYVTLGYINLRFFLCLEQSRTALLGCHLAASLRREAVHWQ